MRRIWMTLVAVGLAAASPLAAQERESITPGPDRAPGEGDGPFERLIIRGATLIDGTGAPGRGPMDIVIQGNRIVEIKNLGAPGREIDPEGRPQDATREIDAHGMYVLPGLVDLHAHTGGNSQGTPAEYVYKLWMAHGVTTIRDPGVGAARPTPSWRPVSSCTCGREWGGTRVPSIRRKLRGTGCAGPPTRG
jgi:hypothetical protein